MRRPPPLVLLLDGNWLTHRAHHATPALSHPLTGAPTAAAFAFTRTLLSLVDSLAPVSLAVAWDTPTRRLARTAVYPEYKAGRGPRPHGLSAQMEDLGTMLRDVGIPSLCVDGAEADDVLATLAVAAAQGLRSERGDVVIVTGDKDMMQIVDDAARISLYIPGPRGSVTWVGEPEVEAKFGVLPPLVPQVQALIGDSVDNIRGVNGVGPKTAASLIRKYGSLDALLDALESDPAAASSAKLKSILRAADDVRLNLELTRLDTAVPGLPPLVPPPSTLPHPLTRETLLNVPGLVDFCARYGFKSLLRKGPSGRGGAANQAASRAAAAPTPPPALVTADAVAEWLGTSAAPDEPVAVLPPSSSPNGQLVLGTASGGAIAVAPSSSTSIGQVLGDVLASHRLVAFDAVELLRELDVQAAVDAAVDDVGAMAARTADTSGHNPARTSLTDVAFTVLRTHVPQDEPAAHVAALLQMHREFTRGSLAASLPDTYVSEDLAAIPPLVDMALAKVPLGPSGVDALADGLVRRVEILEAKLDGLTGTTGVNYNAPRQVSQLLFGDPTHSVAQPVLDELTEANPSNKVPATILAYRAARKAASAIPKRVAASVDPATGRVPDDALAGASAVLAEPGVLDPAAALVPNVCSKADLVRIAKTLADPTFPVADAGLAGWIDRDIVVIDAGSPAHADLVRHAFAATHLPQTT